MQLSRRLRLPVNEKRVERLVRESGLLSVARRKKYSEEVCAARRAAESMKRMRSCGAALLFLQPPQGICAGPCGPALRGRSASTASRHPDTRLALDSLELLVERLEGRTEGAILHSGLGSSMRLKLRCGCTLSRPSGNRKCCPFWGAYQALRKLGCCIQRSSLLRSMQ